MYAPFFGLQQQPFSIAPDPRFLFMSAMHREALAHLIYGLGSGGGFVLLTGEIGAGKTTVGRCFLEQVPAEHHVAYIFNPRLTVVELLQTVCQEFAVPAAGDGGSIKTLVDALNGFMLAAHAAGRSCVLVIDEAQNLSADVLEQLRLLTNLETDQRKLLQIILIGQPELRSLLARPELEQLAQRVVARYHLGTLSADETADYVRHRLAVAGTAGLPPFDAACLRLVHRLSKGVPRRINLLCDRALLGAYAQQATRVDRRILRRAAQEVFDARPPPVQATPLQRLAPAIGQFGALAAVAGLLAWWTSGTGPSTPARVAALPASAVPAALAAASAPADVTPDTTTLRAGAFSDEAAALRQLAQRWHLDLPASEDPCEAARVQGLLCHRGEIDFAGLQKLDRPAALELSAGDGLPVVHVLLQSIGGTALHLTGAAGTWRVPRDALAPLWNGHFTTFWQPPPGFREPVVERASEPAGQWLLARLIALQGELPPGVRRSEEQVLQQRVFAFQVQQGLRLDGLAGPVTLMQVNRSSGIDEPRLSTAK